MSGKLKNLVLANKRATFAIIIVSILLITGIILAVVFTRMHHHKKHAAHKTVSHFVHDHNKLTLFHLEGCHHCQNLMPVWHRLKAKHGNMMLDFEAGHHPELMKHHKIKSYPTIMMNGVKYEGDRSYEDLEKFMKKHMKKE